MRVIDVMHLGRPHVIGCWEVDGALVDPGPQSSMETLLEAIGDEQPRALAPHPHPPRPRRRDRRPGAALARASRSTSTSAAPRTWSTRSKLLASAGRLYGDQMERLWGEIVPVPEANVRALAGGETVLGMRVAYTPGHASHHVCYLHEESGTAFVGDVAAVLIPDTGLIVPPTPPPDIDVETWEDSIGIVEGWRPERLAVTHFGAIEDPAEHLPRVRERLREEAALARELDEDAYEERHRARVAEAAVRPPRPPPS